MNRQVYPEDFIRDVLIGEIGDISKSHAYLSYLLICSGIEFLGRCISENDWSDRDNKTPFIHAIETLFPANYHPHSVELYESLRCGLLHAMTPGKIAITEVKNDPDGAIPQANHPYDKGKQMVLVLEYFYADFMEACNLVLSGKFTSEKMKKPLIQVGTLL